MSWHSAQTDSLRCCFAWHLESSERLPGVCKKSQRSRGLCSTGADLFFFSTLPLSFSPVNRLTASPPECNQCEFNVLLSTWFGIAMQRRLNYLRIVDAILVRIMRRGGEKEKRERQGWRYLKIRVGPLVSKPVVTVWPLRPVLEDNQSRT